MIIMVHDKSTNNFYVMTAGLLVIKGLEHGDVDGLIFTKELLRQVKPLDLTTAFPAVRISKLYQITTDDIHSEIKNDPSLDPQPFEIPSVIPVRSR